MKDMPLPFDFGGKGVSELGFVAERENHTSSSSCSSPSSNPFSYQFLNPLVGKKWEKEVGFVDWEPTSVLESINPSPPTSTSTLSSSLSGGGGFSDTAVVAAVSGKGSQKWLPVEQGSGSSMIGGESGCGNSELRPVPPSSAEIGGGGGEKCGMGMEEWEGVLPESVAAAESPSQEQSILRWIMGDVEDPSMGLNKLLQSGGSAADFEFNGGFGVVDQGSGGVGLDSVVSGGGNFMGMMNNPSFPKLAPNTSSNHMFSPLSSNLVPISLSPTTFNQHPPFDSSDAKPQIFNPQMLINHHQAQLTQNPSLFMPLTYPTQEQYLFMPPNPKRHNSGGLEPNCPLPKVPFSGSEHELLRHQQLQLGPQYVQQRSTMVARPKMGGEEMGLQNQHQHQGLIDQLYNAAELVQTGNSVLAQGILARLNHQLSPIGKPFHRAAFYCKEALQLLLHTSTPSSLFNSPFNLVFKIGAYKSFSEVSPFLQFANFTCNQAMLEVLEGFDRIHIVDFDIGYGGQWASFMQELALRGGGAPSLKITAFASPSTHDQFELGLTHENLNHFAAEMNMAFEFEILSLDSLNTASWSLPPHVADNEAIAVNLPIGSISNYQLSLPLVLRFIKQLSPKIVVCVDRVFDRTDLIFPNHVTHVLQSYSNLLESLDAVNVNMDAKQKIERFVLQPEIEKIVMGRYHSPEKATHWRTLFLSSGFSPLAFSNFAESQAECVVKRTPVPGFHIEKKQSSLVLCWQRKELISASAWRC